MTRHPTPLKFVVPGWFAMVMGLAGLSLAWHRATPLMGEWAGAFAVVWGALAALVFVALCTASLLRLQRHPHAWEEDRHHPVRHPFIATLPVSAILLTTVGVALTGPAPVWDVLWWAASLAQFGITLWVLSRWWLGNQPAGQVDGRRRPPGLVWAGVTPALYIPVVGNVLTPLAGVPLGHAEWSAAQFGVGLFFWPVVTALLAVRIGVQGLWPERLLPTAFIFIAPPAVCGLAALQLGAPVMLAWLCWGIALFCFLWVAALARRIAALPFGLPHWGMSFPLTALSALTLRLTPPGSTLAMLGPLLLALTSLVILGLLLGTLRGLRNGSLLAPEPVASTQPAQAPTQATPG